MSGNGPAWSQLVSSCSFCDCIVHSRSGVTARRKGGGGEGEKGGEGREGEGVRGEMAEGGGERKGEEKKWRRGRKTEGA